MPPTTTLSVRISVETRERLERLAEATRRSKSFLAAEAIDGYVTRELEIVEGILDGMEDARAGRLVPHEEAMARLERTIAAARMKKQRRKKR